MPQDANWAFSAYNLLVVEIHLSSAMIQIIKSKLINWKAITGGYRLTGFLSTCTIIIVFFKN